MRMRLIQTLLSLCIVAAFDSCSLLDNPDHPVNVEMMTFSYYRDNMTSEKRDVTLTDFVYKALLFYLNQTGKYSLEESESIARKITSFGCWCQQRSSLPAGQEPGTEIESLEIVLIYLGRTINRLDELCKMHYRCRHCASIDYFSANNGCTTEYSNRQNCQMKVLPYRQNTNFLEFFITLACFLFRKKCYT